MTSFIQQPHFMQLDSAPQPRWNTEHRKLLVGRCVIKEYRVPSFTQETILSAFEEEGWPYRIDDPLPPLGEIEPKCRLHDTIKRLNRHHKNKLIRFRGDGTGEGVCWEYVDQAALALPFDPETMQQSRSAA